MKNKYMSRYDMDKLRMYVPSLCGIPEAEILTTYEIEYGKKKIKKKSEKELKDEFRKNRLIRLIDDDNLFIELKKGLFIVEFQNKHNYNPGNDNMEMLGYINLNYLDETFINIFKKKNNNTHFSPSEKVIKRKKVLSFLNGLVCYNYICSNNDEKYIWFHPYLNMTFECINYNTVNIDFIIKYNKVVHGIYKYKEYSLCKRINKLNNNLFKKRNNKVITNVIFSDIINILKQSPIIYKLVNDYKLKHYEIVPYILSLMKCSDDIFNKFNIYLHENNCDLLADIISKINMYFNFDYLDGIINILKNNS